MGTKTQAIPYNEYTTAEIAALTNMVKGEIVINTTTHLRETYNGSSWISETKAGTGLFGDVVGGNYAAFEADGTLVFYGAATMWENLQVNVNSLPVSGTRSPERVIIANDGTTTIGHAMSFDGGNDNGTVAYYAGMDTTNLTIAMWIKPNVVNNIELLDRNIPNGFEFYIDNGNLIFAPRGGTRVTANGIIAGATQFIVATARVEGSNLRCKLYINGTSVAEQVIAASLAQASGGYIIGEYKSGGWNYDGIIDNLQTYTIVLTDAQILELYNNGAGTNNLPTGITASKSLIMFFQDDLINQTTMLGALNLVQHGFTFVDGLVGITSGSFGVTALKFKATSITEIFFTAQLPHSYKEGTDIEPHSHWGKIGTATGNVHWGFEYIWVNVSGTFNNTSIITANLTPSISKKHDATNIATLTGTDKKISSILMCRLYRDPTNVGDTFNDDIYLYDFDFHFQRNTLGSRTTWVK